MGKIMTNIELINRMKELLNEPNFYGSGGSNWSSYVNGGWYVDCTCSIKAILWGGRFIPENRGKAHAGCKYGSNGVPDFTPAGAVEWTNATRGNFNNLVPGELLIMTSHGHAGLYIGNGEVIEVTPAWTGGNPGCQISQIGRNGERIKNGRQVLSWEWHGKIPVVDYINKPEPPAPTPTHKYKIGDVVNINGVYVSSTSTDKLNPAITRGTITRIVEARNPYLLDNGNIGWVNDDCIVINKVNYLSNTNYTGVSIIDALKEVGVDSSYQYRARLAEVNNISNYHGTAEQNTKMLNMLKKGILKSL